MMKMPGLLILLGFAMCVAATQVETTSDEGFPSSRVFFWRVDKLQRPDKLQLWLAQNESLVNRGDVCTVSTSYVDEQTKFRTSRYELVSFVVVPQDGEVTTIIQDTESGIGVRVGVHYQVLESDISGLMMVLAFEGAPKDVFGELSRSEAETLRDPRWKSMAITKQIRAKERRYTYWLGCENGKTFYSTFRRRK